VVNALAGGSFNQHLDVVVGPANSRLEEIVNACKKLENAQVHIATNDMAGLIARADLAVSAAGTSLWEFAYSGLPAIAISIAENQLPLAESIGRLSCGMDLGSLDNFNEKNFLLAIAKLINDPKLLSSFSHNSLAMIDGEGRLRVVDLVQQIV